MNLLIFFALPLATILLAIVLQKILQSPILVAITFFGVYLIILFALYASGVITDLAFGLIAIIVYVAIAFITAYLAKIITIICKRYFKHSEWLNNSENNGNNNFGCEINNNENTISTSNNFALTGNVISNQCNNGKTGWVRGCYRRY